MNIKNNNIIENTTTSKVFTVPNILTILRILLLPLFVYLYMIIKTYFWAAALLLFISITDFLDGYIARKYDLISTLGKILDPIADKLTQFAVLVCLIFTYRIMIIPLVALFIKDLICFILGTITVRKTLKLKGARFHGKVSTSFLFLLMGIHVLWYNIPQLISIVLVTIATSLILTSFVLYTTEYIKVLSSTSKKNENTEKE